MPSFRTSLTLESLRDLADLLDNQHQQGGMSDGLIDARKAIRTKLMEVDAGYARPNNVTRNNGTGKYEPVSKQSSSVKIEPAWVNDVDLLNSTDPVIKQAYKTAFNVYMSTGEYPISLDPFIKDLKDEQDKMKSFCADEL